MEKYPLLISVLVFIVSVLSALAIMYYFKKTEERRKLIGKVKEKYKDLNPGEAENFSVRESGVKKYFLKVVAYFGNLVRPKSEKELSRRRKALLRCGYRRENALIIFFGFKVFFAILMVAFFLLFKFLAMKPIPQFYSVFFLVLMATTGFYLPDIFLHLKTNMRKRKLLENFPDALDLMVICVEAGLGLDSAINRVGEEMKFKSRVTSEEFKLLSLELRGGKKRTDALKNLALRTDLEDINSLVTLLIQTDKFGTRVAQALRVYSDSMRTKRYQRAEEMATKLPVKLVFPLIFFIFPSLFVTILGPVVIQVYRKFLSP
jgi:tight adherence protein C